MEGPTNSEILWAKIHLAERRLFAATHLFWNHHDLRRLLPQFLMQAHCIMRSSISLMAAAREYALTMPDDPVAYDLAKYLGIHLNEEQGHDQWLLDDICTLGFSMDEVVRVQPCASVVSLIGSQYFWMRHIHPVSVMGYLILAEGYAPLTSQLEEIRIRSGAPESAFRCLKRHAEDDPSHLADLNRTLDKMTLTHQQARAVAMCAFEAIENIAAMFEELLEYSGNATGALKELQDACP